MFGSTSFEQIGMVNSTPHQLENGDRHLERMPSMLFVELRTHASISNEKGVCNSTPNELTDQESHLRLVK